MKKPSLDTQLLRFPSLHERVAAYWKHMAMTDNLYDNSDGGVFLSPSPLC